MTTCDTAVSIVKYAFGRHFDLAEVRIIAAAISDATLAIIRSGEVLHVPA
jgi:hypothetical protein